MRDWVSVRDGVISVGPWTKAEVGDLRPVAFLNACVPDEQWVLRSVLVRERGCSFKLHLAFAFAFSYPVHTE